MSRDDAGYELIEHTADIGLRVWATSLEEVFAQAAVALIAAMGSADGAAASEHVELEARDTDALFVDWLSEVLFLFEARSVVPHDVRVRIDRDTFRLDATIQGVRAESFVQEGAAVKAVTFHGLELSETEATVYLDV